MGEGQTHTSWSWRRVALWAGLALLACAWDGGDLLDQLYPPRDRLIDFFQEWASGRYFRDGLPVYSGLREACDRYLGFSPDVPERLFYEVNAHPPTSILLGVALAGLDYPVAMLVWNLLSLAALAVSLLLIARNLEISLSPWLLLPAVALGLMCFPLREQVIHGQLNLVLLLLVTGIWTADRSGRPYGAGMLLGVATALKLFPAFLFLYFVLRRQWRTALAGLITIAVLTAFTAAVLGPAVYGDYVANVLPQVREWRSAWNNASLMGFWSRLFNPGGKGFTVRPLVESPLLAKGATLVSCAAITALVAWRTLQARTRDECDRAFGLAVTAMLLVSPLTWEHYFLLLALPLALLWVRRDRAVVLWGLWIIVPVLWVSPAIFYCLIMGIRWGQAWPIGTPWHAVTALAISCYALVGCFALGFWDAQPGAGRASGPRSSRTGAPGDPEDGLHRPALAWPPGLMDYDHRDTTDALG